MRWMGLLLGLFFLGLMGTSCYKADSCGFPCKSDGDCLTGTCVSGRCSGMCSYEWLQETKGEPRNERVDEVDKETWDEEPSVVEEVPVETDDEGVLDGGEELVEVPSEKLPEVKVDACVRTEPSTEVCDGKDNDCDGVIDEIQEKCYQGPSETLGKGMCQEGTRSCTNGAWSTCKGQVLPKDDVCDGKDNDCDGVIDEPAYPCFVGQTNFVDRGACPGSRVCKDGKLQECLPNNPPEKEVCDNRDNDCDGLIDEELTLCVTTVVGSANSPGYRDGPQGVALFFRPTGTAIDGQGNVYVLDSSNSAIRRIGSDGRVTTVAGGFTGSLDATGREAKLLYPGPLVFHQGKNGEFLYFIDHIGGNGKVRRVNLRTKNVVTLSKKNAFAEPTRLLALAVDDDGVVYVTDAKDSVVRKYDPSQPPQAGVRWPVVAGAEGKAGVVLNAVTGADARFCEPHGLVWFKGSLYLTDRKLGVIFQIELGKNAKVTKFAGAPLCQKSCDCGQKGSNKDGSLQSATFLNPKAMAVDEDGTLYVVGGSRNIRRVQKTPASGTDAVSSFLHENTGLPVHNIRAYSFAVHKKKLVLPNDLRHWVEEVDLSGSKARASILSGKGVASSGASSSPLESVISKPMGLWFDGKNTANKVLYIAEQATHRIRKVTGWEKGKLQVSVLADLSQAFHAIKSKVGGVAGGMYKPAPVRLALRGEQLYFVGSNPKAIGNINYVQHIGSVNTKTGVGSFLTKKDGTPFQFGNVVNLATLRDKLYVVDDLGSGPCIHEIDLVQQEKKVIAGKCKSKATSLPSFPGEIANRVKLASLGPILAVTRKVWFWGRLENRSFLYFVDRKLQVLLELSLSDKRLFWKKFGKRGLWEELSELAYDSKDDKLYFTTRRDGTLWKERNLYELALKQNSFVVLRDYRTLKASTNFENSAFFRNGVWPPSGAPLQGDLYLRARFESMTGFALWRDGGMLRFFISDAVSNKVQTVFFQ